MTRKKGAHTEMDDVCAQVRWLCACACACVCVLLHVDAYAAVEAAGGEVGRGRRGELEGHDLVAAGKRREARGFDGRKV